MALPKQPQDTSNPRATADATAPANSVKRPPQSSQPAGRYRG